MSHFNVNNIKTIINMYLYNSSRYDHVYVLEIELYDGITKKTRTSTHEQTVARYFDENGLLLNKSLHNDMFKWFNAISEEKKSN